MLLTYPMPDNSVFTFSTTRHGGCGNGTYGTFNCTPYTGDEQTTIQLNQKKLAAQLDIDVEQLIIPYQTHSCNILTIDNNYMLLSAEKRHSILQEKDALITHIKGICLCISTADCIPVLLYDHTHRVIAAIHAGWRGTVAHIVRKTFQSMHEIYDTKGDDVYAIIGPGISLEAFEIGTEVYQQFQHSGFSMKEISYWEAKRKKHHIDLSAANLFDLQSAGVPLHQIYDCGICTYSQNQDFFSARRLGIKSGRILNGIILK